LFNAICAASALFMPLIEVLFPLIKLKLEAKVLFVDVTKDAILALAVLIIPSSDVKVMFMLATDVFNVDKLVV
jgi:hypothetical protein